jgi:cysteine and histidine-rich domain-containing protein
MTDTKPVHCYNKGCLKEFLPGQNNATACIYHPGEPYFHDAYKEWTCCKKKSVDFTEFLNYKGCATSFHNPTKPPEKEKPKASDVLDVDPVEVAKSRPREPLLRPEPTEPMTRLKPEVTPSLSKALAEQLAKLNVGEKSEGAGKEVKVGDPCQQRGCGKTFTGPER